jgi:uncharacterized protein
MIDDMEHKVTPRGFLQVKAAADGSWWVEGKASTFGGPPDSQGDIIQRGAFAASIRQRKTKLYLEHEFPIGTELELRETDTALVGRWSISQTDRGREAHQLVLDGVLDALSIGFVATGAKSLPDASRLLTEISLLEVSLVALGANERALVTSAKAARGRSSGSYDARARMALMRHRLVQRGVTPPRATPQEERLALRMRLTGVVR